MGGGSGVRRHCRAGYVGAGRRIAAAIQAAMELRSARTEITQDMVIKRWWDIATADPNDLIQFRRICCRHCHGKKHLYQWSNP